MKSYIFVLTTPTGVKSENFCCNTRREAEALAVGIKTGSIYCGRNIDVQVFDHNNKEIIKK